MVRAAASATLSAVPVLEMRQGQLVGAALPISLSASQAMASLALSWQSRRAQRRGVSACSRGYRRPTSGTMIAMCTTMVGLAKVAEGRRGSTNLDVYAALLGAAFLTCAIMTYISIRTAHVADLSRRLERAADATFMASLCAAVAIVVLFALEAI